MAYQIDTPCYLFTDNQREILTGLTSAYHTGVTYTTPHYLGDTYQGGEIFYLSPDGNSGMIFGNMSSYGVNWGCSGTTIGTSIEMWSGYTNTMNILSGCSTSDIAARKASEYNGGGYNDWFLPSFGDLITLRTYWNNTYGFEYNNGRIWSSSERSSTNAWVVFNTFWTDPPIGWQINYADILKDGSVSPPYSSLSYWISIRYFTD